MYDLLTAQISYLIAHKNFNEARDIILAHHTNTITTLLILLPQDDVLNILKYIVDDLDASIISHLPYHLCEYIIRACNSEKRKQFISHMKRKFAIDIIGSMHIWNIMDNTYASETGFKYHKTQMGYVMRNTPVLYIDYTGYTARSAISDIVHPFYPVCNHHNVVQGIITLQVLLSTKDNEQILYNKLFETVYDTENIMRVFSRNEIVVINSNNHVCGVILHNDIIDEICRVENCESELYTPFIQISLERLKWIFVTMSNSLCTSMVISQFDDVLSEYKTIPIVMSSVAAMGGTTGAQTVTVMVRTLATKSLHAVNIHTLVHKESLIGMTTGIISGVVLGCIVSFWKYDILLGLILCISVFINMLFAGISGTIVTMLLHKLNYDPALSASPIVTALTDILGYTIFLLLATYCLL